MIYSDIIGQEKYVRIARMGFIGSGVVVFIVCIWNTIRFIKVCLYLYCIGI